MHDMKIRIWPLLLLSTVLCIMRCVQYVFYIDRMTGYVTSDLFNMIVVLFCTACAVLFSSPVLQNDRSFSMHSGQGNPLTMAASFICAMFFVIFSVVTVWQNIAVHTFNRLSLLLAAFGVISAVYFVILFLSKGEIRRNTLLTVFGPICFYAYRLVATFNRLTLNTEVMSYRLLLISSGVSLLFFSFLGRTLLDKTGAIRTIIFGRLAFFFLAASSVCPLIMRIWGEAGSVSVFTEDVPILMLLADAVMMIYILAVIRSIKAERIKSIENVKVRRIKKTKQEE